MSDDIADFDGIMQGLSEAVGYVEGTANKAAFRVHAPAQVDVRAIRNRLGLSQADFADRFGFKVPTLQDWEQGRRRPEASARVLLTVIDREPEAVRRALEAG